jgi:hypothetical protein
VLGPSGSVPPFSVPEADEANLLRPHGQGRVELPEVISLEGVCLFRRRTEFLRHHKEGGEFIVLDGIIPVTPAPTHVAGD